jgi:hypothetical protein
MSPPIQLIPGRKYPLTREVFRASLDELLEQETRRAKTPEQRKIVDDVRDEWSNAKRFESYYRVWRAWLGQPVRDEE